MSCFFRKNNLRHIFLVLNFFGSEQFSGNWEYFAATAEMPSVLSKFQQSYGTKLFQFFVFSIWVFFHEHSEFTGQQGKGEGIYFTPLCHFLPLHRHLDISRVITAESSPLNIASSRTRTGNLWLTVGKHTERCWGIDQFFKSKYRPVA